MDVNTTQNFQAISGAGKPLSQLSLGEQKQVAAASSKVERPEENVMMDLNEMKNFLYLLIGSSIKLKSESPQPGSTFNSVA